jgi:hypothetical protein
VRSLIVLLFLAMAPAAAAAPVALLDAPHAGDVAIAGAEVVVARDLPRGGVRVDTVTVQGGAVRHLLSLSPPRRRWHGRAFVAASAERVAVLVAFDDSGDRPRERRLYSGPPAGPLRLDFTRRITRAGGWFSLDVDVDADRILLAELRFPHYRSRIRVLLPGVAQPARVPWSGPLVFTPAALAGDHVALTGVRRAFVADVRSGTREASIRIEPGEEVDGLDLATDGRLVAATDGRLLTVAPGVAQAVVPGSAGHELSAARFAGSRVGALERTRFDATRPVVLDPGAAAPRVVGTSSTAFGPFAADERGLAWIANGCVLYAPLDGPPPAEPPAGPCPRAEVTLQQKDELLHGHHVRIAVTCIAAPASGCSGSAVLGDRRIAGRGAFNVPSGAAAVVDVELAPGGLRRVRRALRRRGYIFLALDARLQDGRVPGGGTWIVIDGLARSR